MYSYQGRPTPYSQLPANVQRNVRKTPRVIQRQSGRSSVSTPREQIRQREQMYEAGYRNIPTMELSRESKDTKSQRDYGVQKSPNVVSNVKETIYTYKKPDGTTYEFKNKKDAQAFADQFATTRQVYYVTVNGKSRPFRSEQEAQAYANKHSKVVESYVGFSDKGEAILGAPKPEFVTVEYPQEGDKYVTVSPKYEITQKTIEEKPLSSTGERLQTVMGWLEEKQKEAVQKDPVRYYRGVGGVPQKIGGGGVLAMGIEVAKDTLAGAAYVENVLWEAEAKVRGGNVKTAPIKIPETATGVIIQGAMERKTPAEIYKIGVEYEKTHGQGTIISGFAGAFIPIPGAKGINLISPITKSTKVMKVVTPIASAVKFSRVKNVLTQVSEKITVSKQTRIVKKYAKERAGEGVYGIRKIGKNVFAIERGFEESGKVVSGGIQPRIIGFTKDVKHKLAPIIPQFAKVPKKQVMPPAAKTAQVPLTIIEFGKEYIKKGKTLTEKIEPFEKIPAQKLPIMKKMPKGKPRQKVSKSFSLSKSIGSGLKLVKPINLKSRFIKSLGIKQKTTKVKSKTVKVTEVTDFFVPEQGAYQTVGTKRVLVTSADPEFIKQANQLKLRKIAGSSYQGQMSKELVEAEQLGLVQLTAIGKTAPLKLAIKGDRKLLEYVGKKARITKVFQTSGAGLGKGKGFIERTKQEEFISVGSKDFERKLESVGLGQKRKYTAPKTPFKMAGETATGMGTGKARVMTESTKQQILSSYEQAAKKINDAELKITGKMSKEEKISYYKNIAKGRRADLDKTYPNIIGAKQEEEDKVTNYLLTKSRYRIKQEYSIQGGDISTEEITIRYPNKIESITRISSRGLTTRFGTRQRSVLDTTQFNREKLRSEQQDKLRIKTKNVLVIKGKTRIETSQIPSSITGQTTRLETGMKIITRQTTTQVQKLLIKETPPITSKTKITPWFLIPNIAAKRRTRKTKEKPDYAADFLGAASEYSVFGITSREDVTYGQKRIAKLTAIDRRKRAKTPAMNNPESTKITRTKKKKKEEFLPEKPTGSVLTRTKVNLLGKNKKVKF